MASVKEKKNKRARRHRKIRAKMHGTRERPRLAVFRSNKYTYAQLLDDDKGETLVQVNSKDSGGDAHAVGVRLAEEAQKQNIETVVFDRGGFLYTGNIKAIAEGAREGGLQF